MADLKKHMSRHLRSARQWLTRAEESIDKDHDIRAELDLMLAQAELQHAKETKRSGVWRYKYFVLRHGFALGLALLVAVGGLGGSFYLLQGRAAELPPVIKQQQPSAALPGPEPATLEPVPEKAPAAPVPVQPVQVIPAVQSKPANVTTADRQEPPSGQRNAVERADASLELSPDEMQKLMRAAGKSLRGQ